MERKLHKVTVIVPCYNEEAGIGSVVSGFNREELRHSGYDLEVIVVDNNSTDRTAAVAKKAGARVVTERTKGKGNAIRTAFKSISADTDYVVMLDGDDTYSSKEILRMLEPLKSDFCDVIIGSRMSGRIKAGSMTLFNRSGNWIFSHLVRYFYRANVTDCLTGYFAWKKYVVDSLAPHLTSPGFAIEMEMVTKMARLGCEMYSVPISYHPRSGESNLNPIKDGYRIMKMFLKNLFWFPPVSNTRTIQTKGMTIAFVSDAIYPYNKGGKEKRLFEISTRLAKLGHDVHIYTMHWWSTPETMRTEQDVHIHAISPYYPLYVKDRRSIKQGILFGIACIKLLRAQFDVLDVDHMPFFPVFSTWIVCLLKGKKLHGTWHEALSPKEWIQYMGRAGYVAAFIERLSIMLPYRITAASPQTKELLASYHHRAKRVAIVASGIDLALIHRVKPVVEPCDVLYAGRLVKDKHVDILVRAIGIVAKRNPDVRCTIIGHGIERDNLRRLIKRLKLESNITMLSPLPDAADVYAYMKQAKVFVLPSTREGFGIVALEAISCGTPVITTNSPANAAKDLIVPGETGSIVRLTPTRIAAAISNWLTGELKEVSMYTQDAYDWNTLAKKQVEVYTS